MVKNDKSRVMISLTKKSLKELDDLCDAYGMTKSQVLQMLVVVFHRERISK